MPQMRVPVPEDKVVIQAEGIITRFQPAEYLPPQQGDTRKLGPFRERLCHARFRGVPRGIYGRKPTRHPGRKGVAQVENAQRLGGHQSARTLATTSTGRKSDCYGKERAAFSRSLPRSRASPGVGRTRSNNHVVAGTEAWRQLRLASQASVPCQTSGVTASLPRRRELIFSIRRRCFVVGLLSKETRRLFCRGGGQSSHLVQPNLAA